MWSIAKPYKHYRRYEQFMRFVGMKNELDELRCPRCGLILKEKGVPFKPNHFNIYSNHLGSLKCRVREKYGEANNKTIKKYISSLMGEPPLCKCGCGRRVNFNLNLNRWNSFVRGACAAKYFAKAMKVKRLKMFLRRIGNGELQNEVCRRLNIDSKTVSKNMVLAEKLGLIKRIKENNNGRWTYRIVKEV
jgi:hypothetical protein